MKTNDKYEKLVHEDGSRLTEQEKTLLDLQNRSIYNWLTDNSVDKMSLDQYLNLLEDSINPLYKK